MEERVSLIVDDEPAIRSYLKSILQSQQIQSLEADSAVQALQLVWKLGGRVDLIISDIQMPGDMSGVDLAYSVKNSFPALPVILISGYVDEAPAGFIFVRKPFLPEAILAAINKVVPGKVQGASP